MMRLLLDTHVFLWCLRKDRRLTRKLMSRIASAQEVYVSSASVWEAAIKIAVGKLHADIDQIAEGIETSGFRELPISARHAARVASLPVVHHDPFDRLLVAQALEEPLQLITADPILAQYSDLVDVC